MAALPPTVGILLRGAGLVLGACLAVSGTVGFVLGDSVAVLNSAAVLGVGVLSCGVVFYSLGLSRSGLTSPGTAARAMTRVLAGSATATTVLYTILLRDADFRAEVCEIGPVSVVGVGILGLFGVIGVTLLRAH